MTLRLETCGGAPLDGGVPAFGTGSSSSAWYWSGGATGSGSNDPGESTAEAFPGGTYNFEMRFKGTEQKMGIAIADPPQNITWKTTLVTLIWPGAISYGGSTGDAAFFNKPSMEMLPDTYRFHFRPYPTNPGNTVDLTVGGCNYNGGYMTLVDEVGAPLANYPADYPGETRNLKYKYRCGGTWAPWTSFQTDANGQVFYNIDCSTVGSGTGNWDKKITMVLNQTSLEQDVTVNSTFQTAKVNVNLNTCNPATPLSGGTVMQGGGFWYTHGTTDGSGTRSFYAFPNTVKNNKVKVKMSYNLIGSQTQVNVPVVFPTTDIDFTTTTVNIFGSSVKINAGGWPVISMPTELLPGNYKFRIDGTQTGNVAISGCDYSGGLLTVIDELGNGVEGSTFTPACGGSWYTELAGATDADGELFAEIPACMTKIRANVGNSSQQQTLAQLNGSGFTYTTEVLRIILKDHVGSAITDQTGSLKQGGGTWIGLGNFNTSGYVDVQTFPTASGKYAATYNFTSQEKAGIGVTGGAGIQELDFQTGQVNSACGHTQYQGAGWSTFTSGMELMPGTRTYRYPVENVALSAGQVLNLTCP
jgi:hypothetical protein